MLTPEINGAWVDRQALQAYAAIMNHNVKFECVEPVPGWRIDYVYSDGKIADYTKTVRQAQCFVNVRTWRDFPEPALAYCQACQCGFRVCPVVWALVYYFGHFEVQRLMTKVPAEARGFGRQPYKRGLITPVLTRVQMLGLAEASLDVLDPEGTVRASKTRLVEVFLPTEYDGQPVPDGIARKIRDRYRVTVRRIPGSVMDFQGTKDTPQPELWGEYLQPLKEEIREARQYKEQYG